MTNIILADDHTIIREGVKILLEYQSDIKIVGEAASGIQVLKILEQNIEANVLLSDLDMPDMDGLALLQKMKEDHPNIKVIVLTMKTGEAEIEAAFARGASAFLLKTAGIEEIIYAIQHVISGKKYLSSELSQMYFEKALANSSTKLYDNLQIEFNSREVEVLNLIAQGLTNFEMSEKLFLSKRTVEGQRQALIEKTGTKNTAALIKFAIVNGIID